MFKVVEIFHSIEGEGKRAGQTAGFLRLFGCNLRCSYCDTTYAIDGEYVQMSIDEILTRLNQRRFFRVTITGGEPLMADGIEILIKALLEAGYEVNIETNGSVDIAPMLPSDERLFFTMDYKLPSSGEEAKMNLGNFNNLRPWDVLKFVIGSQADLEKAQEILAKLTSHPQIYMGVVHGGYPLDVLADAIVNNDILKDASLQLQFHKIIWDSNKRGV